METNRHKKKMKKMKKMNNQQKNDFDAIKKSMSKALKQYIKDKSSVKEFSLCMQESSQWLKEKEK